MGIPPLRSIPHWWRELQNAWQQQIPRTEKKVMLALAGASVCCTKDQEASYKQVLYLYRLIVMHRHVIAKRGEAERGLVIVMLRPVVPSSVGSHVAVLALGTSNVCHGFGPREHQMYVTVLAPRSPPQVWHT